jgi:glutaconate CoA-transferase subunit A
MAEITTLKEAVCELVNDGDSVAIEGFSHLVPFAAAHEIIRQDRRNLTLIRLSADIIYDQLIGMGCARKLIFSWSGNPGIGLLHRFRDAIENDWPRAVELEEHSHAGLIAALTAGAARLPFGILRGYHGTDLLKHTASIAPITCPFTGESIMAVRAIRPDVAIIHAQQADRKGNVLFWGVSGIQKEAVLAAKRAIVTVEEIRDELQAKPYSVLLPSWVVTTVVHAPGGARPSYAHGYYARNNEFYRTWDSIARDRDQFFEWMNENVGEPEKAYYV